MYSFPKESVRADGFDRISFREEGYIDCKLGTKKKIMESDSTLIEVVDVFGSEIVVNINAVASIISWTKEAIEAFNKEVELMQEFERKRKEEMFSNMNNKEGSSLSIVDGSSLREMQ